MARSQRGPRTSSPGGRSDGDIARFGPAADDRYSLDRDLFLPIGDYRLSIDRDRYRDDLRVTARRSLVASYFPSRNRARVVVDRRPTLFSPSAKLAFGRPLNVDVCISRRRRREVLFARRKTGKGARSPRKRNYYSDVRC